jgi:uncharacterized protein YjaG (DUF416 family)
MTSNDRSYDERRLVASLSRLGRLGQAVFAATCAERLIPAYERFHQSAGQGDPATLRLLLDAVWAHVQRGEELLTAEGYQGRLDAVTPGESDDWSVEFGLAENAAAAVGYAVDAAIEGDPRNAAWAARHAYEAADLWVRTRDDVDFNVQGAEERVLADPLIQAELRRQQRDLDELTNGEDRPPGEVAARLKKRAELEASVFLASAE